MIRFGIELETLGRWPKDLLPLFQAAGLQTQLACKQGALSNWSLCTDGTFDSKEPNTEVVTPIDPKLSDIAKVIELLKRAGCKTDPRCGLHIHVSDTEGPLRAIIKPTIKVWANRAAYCPKTIYNGRSSGGIRQRGPNHIEVRIFNARLDYHYVLWAWSLVRRSLFRPANQNLDNNDWNTVPKNYPWSTYTTPTQPKLRTQQLTPA